MADLMDSSASTEQWSLWAGRPPRASTTWRLVTARASSMTIASSRRTAAPAKAAGWCDMVISSKGRYALRVMVDLAEHGGDGYVSMRDVARRQEISDKYAGQIKMCIRDRPGVHGALRQAQPPGDLRRGIAQHQLHLQGGPIGVRQPGKQLHHGRIRRQIPALPGKIRPALLQWQVAAPPAQNGDGLVPHYNNCLLYTSSGRFPGPGTRRPGTPPPRSRTPPGRCCGPG